jgi:PKD repeat protein
MKPIGSLLDGRQVVVLWCLLVLFVSSCGAPNSRDTNEAELFNFTCADLVCEFEALGSSDREIVAWSWSLGDGTSSTSRNPSHVYASEGTFEVTLRVASKGANEVEHTEPLILEASDPVQADPPVNELAYGASEAGRYVTNWTHIPPGFSLTIEDGWGLADTVTAVEVAPLDEWGRRTCDPLARIAVLEGIYDPVEGSIVLIDDLTKTLREDDRLNLTTVSTTEVGGFPATRFNGTLEMEKVDLSWRFCGPGVPMYAIGATNVDDPAYRWIWLPALSNLSFWVVDVGNTDVLIAVAHNDQGQRSLVELETVIASLEFHPPREPVPTRVLHSEFGDIEIFNGTPRLHSLVEWSIGRYSGSRLGSPEVSRVAFSAGAQCHERGYAGGFTETAEVGSVVTLCFGEEQPEYRARQTLLHEFAHSWLEAHRDDEVREEFLSLLDLAAWYPSGPGSPDAGVEYACDVIAWGLLGEPDLPLRFADRSCGTLSEAFRVLSGGEAVTDPTICNR